MHIPSCPTQALEVVPFDAALAQACLTDWQSRCLCYCLRLPIPDLLRSQHWMPIVLPVFC